VAIPAGPRPAPRVGQLPNVLPPPQPSGSVLTGNWGFYAEQSRHFLNSVRNFRSFWYKVDPFTSLGGSSPDQRRSGSRYRPPPPAADRRLFVIAAHVSHQLSESASIRRFWRLHNPPQGTTVRVRRLVPVIRAFSWTRSTTSCTPARLALLRFGVITSLGLSTCIAMARPMRSFAKDFTQRRQRFTPTTSTSPSPDGSVASAHGANLLQSVISDPKPNKNNCSGSECSAQRSECMQPPELAYPCPRFPHPGPYVHNDGRCFRTEKQSPGGPGFAQFVSSLSASCLRHGCLPVELPYSIASTAWP